MIDSSPVIGEHENPLQILTLWSALVGGNGMATVLGGFFPDGSSWGLLAIANIAVVGWGIHGTFALVV
tara:strand:+ start:878 stop:1081 length:204 start_codon:yes stop_codon:yes gene_type:complete